MIRILIYLGCLTLSFSVISQVTDNFSDGDFTTNPVWSGTSNFGVDDAFEIVEVDNQLRSQDVNAGSGTRLSYLSTPSNLDLSSATSEWSFRFRLDFGQPGTAGTNSNNTSRVYLMSSSEDLSGDLNGYYVELRYPASDINEVRLYRQDASTTSEIMLSGTIQSLTSQSFVDVMVTRSEMGLWEVEANSISQGTATDNTYSSSLYFGVQVRFTANSRDNGFYFDDFSTTVTPVVDTDPPTIQSVTAISDTQVDVKFNENVDVTTSENEANYAIDGAVIINSAVLDGADHSLVHLNTSSLSNGSTYTITINNVQDENANPIAFDSEAIFDYIVTELAEPGDVVINEFMADPTPATSFPNIDFIELLNVSDKFLQLSNWTVKDNSESGVSDPLGSFILRPNEYLIITDVEFAADFSVFGDVVGVDNFPNLNATNEDQIIIRDASETVLAQLTYSSSLLNDATTLELINPNDPCLSIASYTLSTDPSGGTPGAQNSVFDATPDTEAPSVQSYNFDTHLTINFSERMDAGSLSSGTYSVSNGLTINQVIVEGDFPTSVGITFNEVIEAGILYEFTLSNVADCSGNLIAETTIQFGLGRLPSFNELVITEIMFDPDPQRELPEAEYIEILNATSDIIGTEGVFLTDATKTINLPARTLNPGEYYVLTTTSAASEFINNVIGVPGFPSLNNTGEQLTLIADSELVFSLTYDPDWHEDDKADGGVSLEMRDVTNPCLENNNNWTSSQHVSGGTPGMFNSVSETIPDNFGPEITSAIALAADSIRVNFNEKIDPASVAAVSITLNPSIGIGESFFVAFNPSTLIITLSESLEQSVPYTLNIENITDCSGNEIEQGEIVLALPIQAEADELKLSEVLFNPRPNGVDFVEIYNSSEKYISLKDWKLARILEEEIDAPKILASIELVIDPGQYLVFTPDAEVLLSNYPKARNLVDIGSLPAYNDDEGTVLLLSPNDEIKQQFDYHTDFHYDLLKSVDGVSLERVSYDERANNPDNWRSAASTEGFATPGYANSQSFNTGILSGRVTADPEVFIPGNSGSGRDFTTINYQFDQAGKFANVNIYDQVGRLVKNLARGASLSTSGFLRWDGDTDDGKMARMGYYLIIFEIYDSSGNSETIKETVVVGRDF